MFCESWRETLSEAILRGEKLPREAESHLDSCERCRLAFSEEQQLFASINGGLGIAANADVPASLVPRVRAAVAEQFSESSWHLPVWAFAGAALLLLGGVAYQQMRAPHRVAFPHPVAVVTPARSAATSPSLDSNPNIVAVPSRLSPSRRTTLVPTVIGRHKPEILVSGEEQTNLQLYLNRLRGRSVNQTTPLVITSDAQIKPLEIAQIELPQLSIAPLESGDSR
jgi:hypothetical protein